MSEIIGGGDLLAIPDVAQIQQALLQAAGEARQLLEQPTQTWNHSVDFVTEVADGGMTVRVYTEDEIYGYVNDGTEAHPISAKNGGRLVFREGYDAKTTPGSLAAKPGGSKGGWRSKKTVQHPGTKARRFTDAASQRGQELLYRQITAIVKA